VHGNSSFLGVASSTTPYYLILSPHGVSWSAKEGKHTLRLRPHILCKPGEPERVKPPKSILGIMWVTCWGNFALYKSSNHRLGPKLMTVTDTTYSYSPFQLSLNKMARTFDPFRSNRLIFRAVENTPEDETFIYDIQRDAEAQSGSSLSLLLPESKKASKKFQEYLQEKALLGTIVCIAPDTNAETTENPTPVGVLAFKPPRAGCEHHRSSAISIDILRPYQGKGYGSEAIEWALGWGFQMAGLHRITIESFSYNTGATRLYEKLGFVLEGRRREEIWFNGGWHDFITFGMLENEWRVSGKPWSSNC
jgi:RimJ/RimL family protein N-acetyltransferase